jgi:hypothetical protein
MHNKQLPNPINHTKPQAPHPLARQSASPHPPTHPPTVLGHNLGPTWPNGPILVADTCHLMQATCLILICASYLRPQPPPVSHTPSSYASSPPGQHQVHSAFTVGTRNPMAPLFLQTHTNEHIVLAPAKQACNLTSPSPSHAFVSPSQHPDLLALHPVLATR